MKKIISILKSNKTDLLLFWFFFAIINLLFILIMYLFIHSNDAEAKDDTKICSLDSVVCEAEGGVVLSPIPSDSTTPSAPQAKEDVFQTSCYTGVESHGKNGIVDGVSVATYRYPQGTWLNIEGIGKRRVDTVTAKRFSNRVDIWMAMDYDGCLKYGLQYRKINVIK